MKRHSVKWAAACLALLTLLAAVQSRRLAERRRAGLPAAYAGYAADAPPALTFILAGLGGFRGIAAEVLWLRADTLQEDGRYLELVQLADWITRLDPHAAEAWAYNAWNLAYNVSSMMIRPEDRARWVRNGIRLLRDDGLRYNPREARLYRELAWLYQNKVGDSLDSAHLAYKLDLAAALAPLLRPDGTFLDTPESRSGLEALRLDPARLVALERRFGPLDWRVAESHALYWATRGVELAQGPERLLCRRGAYQPLIASVFRGRFTGSLETRTWGAAPNLALALAAADYLWATCAEMPSRTQKTILIRFLSSAAQRAAQAQQAALARQLYERLVLHLPPTVQTPTFENVTTGWEPPDEEAL